MRPIVALACPSCERDIRVELPPSTSPICSTCGEAGPWDGTGLTDDGGLTACLACGHPELHTSKDFPQALGIGIVVVAALLAPFTFYASLAVAGLLDALLYRFSPNVVACYACEAAHRGFHAKPRHPGFDRTIFERLRFGERAVMGSPMRPGGTAGAEDPEH
ncbi:MAG: hypothetical protein QF599_04140 [Planctomycetota bacterium]|nr:hypothetical protein [Planctomycetota bacterium]MDP6955144.1 hypothetical protein [Planctomycetota bacterium]